MDAYAVFDTLFRDAKTERFHLRTNVRSGVILVRCTTLPSWAGM